MRAAALRFPLHLVFGLAIVACDPPPPPAESPAATSGLSGGGLEISERVREEIGETVATVNGLPIGKSEFIQVAGRKLRTSEAGALTAEDRQAVLDELTEQKILFLEARAKGYDLDPRVQRLLVQLILQDEVYAEVKSADITDDELRAFFEKHREDFVIPEKIRLRRIFVKAEPTRSSAEAEQIAQRAYQQVRAEPNRFSRVASELSEGPYRGRGGDLGLIGKEPRPGVPIEIIERGFTLKAGEVAAPFQAGGGWNVLFVSERRDRVERTFEQMRGAVVRRAKAEKSQQAYRDYVDGRRQAANVEVFADRLESLRLAGSARSSIPVEPGLGDPDTPERPDHLDHPEEGE